MATVHMNNGGGSADIFGGVLGRRIVNKTFAIQGQPKFPAGHVFKPAAGLNPVPMFAQLSGNMGPASAPVLSGHCLDDGQVFGGNFAVSDDQKFHEKAYSKKTSAKNARI